MFARRLTAFAPLAAILLAGCGGLPGDSYDPKWRYTVRTDPIVVQTPTTHPTDPVVRTTRDEFLRTLPEQGGVILDPGSLPTETRQRLADSLDDMFGTPAEPKVGVGEPEVLSALALDADTLKATSSAFKMRCTTCHGMNGDGRGPSGLYIYPHPRDYRSGKFKLASGVGYSSGRPRFADLMRVLKAGVPGTSMVAFNVLPEADLRGLVGSVIHLSIRGEVEQELVKGLLDTEEPIADLPTEARTRTVEVLKRWQAAQGEAAVSAVILDRPESPKPEYHESLCRGQKWFVSAGCVSCHEGYSSRNVYRFDVWGLPNSVRNLAQPERRWGADAADTARQIRHGIMVANMPGAPTLTDTEVTDLVNFVRELPYPKRLPDDVRREVEK